MNKILHDPSLKGQSFADRMMAAKHSISGQEVTKIIYKATTDEVMGPKRKHLDYLVWCTTNPQVSIPQMANSLIERTHNSSWVVVYKALITAHDLINYGNEDPEFNAPPGIGGTKKYRPPVGDFFLTLSRGFTADQPQYQPQYRPQDQPQLHASPQEPHSGSTTVSTAGSASENQRFTQYLASNNCAFNLGGFLDRTVPLAYDMSAFIRRYARYLNEKCSAYRLTGYDFCKVKRGKDDGYLRTLDTDKLLKVLPILQNQMDVLLSFNATPHELNNGVIVVCFLTLFKDLIRLFACYNDGIINLLEKYFEMNKKHATAALEIYKKFIIRMEGVAQFLKVAETVGIDRTEIPDLAKAPSSLLEALEEHLRNLDPKKPGGVTSTSRPAAAVTSVIRDFSAAAQAGAAVGAGAEGALVITEEERRRILQEEQRQLDALKARRQSSSDFTSGPVAAPRSSVSMATISPATTHAPRLQHSESLPVNAFSDNFSPPANFEPTLAPRNGSSSPPVYTMLAGRGAQNGAVQELAKSPEPEKKINAGTSASAALPPGCNSFGEILKPTTVAQPNQPAPKIDLAALMISSSTPGNMPTTMKAGGFGQTAPVIPMSPTYVIPMSNMYALPGSSMAPSNMSNPYWMQPRIVMVPQGGPMMTPQWGPVRPMLQPQLSLPAPRPYGAI